MDPPLTGSGIPIPPLSDGQSSSRLALPRIATSSHISTGADSPGLSPSRLSSASRVSVATHAMEDTEEAGRISASQSRPTDRDSYPHSRNMNADTRSLTDSVREHVMDGGLQYHAYHAGRYPFPSDEVEQEMDDLKHALMLELLEGRYFYAPVENILRSGGAEVLDLGTGTGSWCTELADEYPDSSFIGLDLSPIQPDYVPPNVHFIVDDIEDDEGWGQPENKFDYIHIRHVLYSVHDRDTLLGRVYRHLKPGGYVELQEFHYLPHADDQSLTPTYPLTTFLTHLRDGLAIHGADLHSVVTVNSALQTAGFENITTKHLKCPVGTWPRARQLSICGGMMRAVLLSGLVGLARKPLAALGWTRVQIEVFLIEVRKALLDSGVHSYLPLHVVFARKPLEEEAGPSQ